MAVNAQLREALTVATYEELSSYVEAFASGHLNLLIIVGGGGLGKSRTVRDALGRQEVCWIESNATALGVYMKVWRHADQPVVIDDVDSIYTDRQGVRLLKSLCQTEAVKRLAWHSASPALRNNNIPQEFSTSSRVVIISNDWRTVNRNIEAVQDRGHVIAFEPSAEEVHRHVRGWFDDEEIVEWFEGKVVTMGRPSIRHYLRAKELKCAGMEWQRVVIDDGGLPARARLVREIVDDRRYCSEGERVEAFQGRRGGCRATYFNWKRRLGLVSRISGGQQKRAGSSR